jgi:adenylate cyclase
MDQPRRRWALRPDPLEGEERPTIEGVVRELGKIPRSRLIVTALIIVFSILIARYSWELPVSVGTAAENRGEWHFPARPGEPLQTIPIATDAERALFDFRQTTAERQNKVAQDERFVLIPFTEYTLEVTALPSPPKCIT